MSTPKTNSISIGPVRIAYPHIFKPRVNDLKESRPLEYEATFLIPKSPEGPITDPKAVYSAIKAAGDAAAALLPGVKFSIKDGNAAPDGGGEPKFPGYMYFSAKCKGEYPPFIYDGSKTQITAGIKSGDYVYAVVKPFPYDQKAKKGVSWLLNAVMFYAEGDAIGNVVTAQSVADMFGDVKGAQISGSALAGAASHVMSDDFDPFAD